MNQRYCYKLSLLVDDNFAASEMYYRAIIALKKLVGSHETENFAEAKNACSAALDHCRRTKVAIAHHKAEHGC